MKGPKEIVAESLANALADFFVIDPTMVETNLLHNAGITLKHVLWKEQTWPIHHDNIITYYATLRGSVENVRFSWSWGGSDWIKDARLTMIGVNFAVTLSEEAWTEPSKKKQDEPDKLQHKHKEDLRPKKGISAYIE
jgi:hypothetical protein